MSNPLKTIKMKRLLNFVLVVTILLTSISTFSQNGNEQDIKDVGLGNWNTFERNVGKELSQTNSYKNVYLDVGGTTIIADYLLELTDGSFKVVEAKASRVTNLGSSTYNLRNRCTKNQKIVFDNLINKSLKARVKTTRENQSETKTIPVQIVLAKGIDFYVTNPKGQYSTSKKRSTSTSGTYDKP